MRFPPSRCRGIASAATATLTALLLGLAAGPAAAQWKWRDLNGRVTASDRPPPREVPDKDIITRPSADAARRALSPAAAAAPAASTAAAPLLARGPLDRELDARKSAAEQEQRTKVKADEERLATQRGENCRRARGHVAALETGQRIARVNEKGEREVLDDRGRADELRQARDVIGSDCR